MRDFEPPEFDPHPFFRGGHLQTIASLRGPKEPFAPESAHRIDLDDGDAIVLHENRPVDGAGFDWKRIAASDERVILLLHGLSGCHGSPYMIRWARELTQAGWIVYRMDLRGCGAAKPFARGLSHAGRSDDCRAALDWIASRHREAAIAAAGVSLGGNQLLKMAGEMGAEVDESTTWRKRFLGLAVVAPPMDLNRCSVNMNRLSRRIYNYYFIRTLFERIPPGVASEQLFQQVARRGRPKTLFELDDQLTAPLSGFESASAYYAKSGAVSVVEANRMRTLVLVADDDPIVPVQSFLDTKWPDQTLLLRMPTGGHAGFVPHPRSSTRGGAWMDQCVVGWLNQL